MQLTVKLTKLNGLGKTHRKYLCSVTDNLARPSLGTNCLRNSDIRWMKVLSFSLSSYFLWRIKIMNRRFLGRSWTNLMTLLLTQTHFETNILLRTKAIWEREKRRLLSYLSAHRKIQTLLRTNHITGFVTVPSEKKKKNYHLAKSENSLQNSDNLLRLKILLDILPWYRNRHAIEYHSQCVLTI